MRINQFCLVALAATSVSASSGHSCFGVQDGPNTIEVCSLGEILNNHMVTCFEQDIFLVDSPATATVAILELAACSRVECTLKNPLAFGMDLIDLELHQSFGSSLVACKGTYVLKSERKAEICCTKQRLPASPCSDYSATVLIT